MMQNDPMRVTVDIDEAVLKELSRLSGEKKTALPSPRS